MLKQFVASAAVAIMLTGVAVAGPFEDGEAAFDEKDYAKALSLWRPLAEQGDPRAQFKVGMLYLLGAGVAESDTEAWRWFGMAVGPIRALAEQGDAVAQNDLGEMYLFGPDLIGERKQASIWFGRAADQGNAKAQAWLGSMYLVGHDTPRDLVLSYVWSSLAAAQGNKIAEFYAETASEEMTQKQLSEAEHLVRHWKAKPEH
jgi:TPR repeat protein